MITANAGVLGEPPCVTDAGDGKKEKKKFNKKWPDLFRVNAGGRCGFPVPLHQITRALMEQVLRK